MFRFKLIMIGVGAFCAYLGFQEFKVSQGTTAEAVAVELADLESGKETGENAHMKVGSHYPVYFELIYYGPEDKEGQIDYAYYPIISENHDFIKALGALHTKYPEGDFPEHEFPRLQEFKVLVKTKRFKTTSDIPDEFGMVGLMEGLVVNKIDGLKPAEQDLLKQSFPTFDPENILILEDGRKPASNTKQYGLMGGGAFLILIGLGWLVVGLKK